MTVWQTEFVLLGGLQEIPRVHVLHYISMKIGGCLFDCGGIKINLLLFFKIAFF